jgi:hypothetical protein
MCASPAAKRRAKTLCAKLEPLLAEAIERNDPAVQGLSFDDIEANSASAGDAVSRYLMVEALLAQPSPTEEEIAEARRTVLKDAGSDRAIEKSADKLRMTTQNRKRRRLRTVRGEIEYERDYLYFPELGRGIFPPRDSSGDS